LRALRYLNAQRKTLPENEKSSVHKMFNNQNKMKEEREDGDNLFKIKMRNF